jgi:hypothetical protein
LQEAAERRQAECSGRIFAEGLTQPPDFAECKTALKSIKNANRFYFWSGEGTLKSGVIAPAHLAVRMAKMRHVAMRSDGPSSASPDDRDSRQLPSPLGQYGRINGESFPDLMNKTAHEPIQDAYSVVGSEAIEHNSS